MIKKLLSRQDILLGLLTASLFSSFIYFAYLDFEAKFLNTITAFIAFYLILTISRTALFYAGFFIGVLWFWWVGISVIHYDLPQMIPVVVLGFGLGYALIFLATSIRDKVLIRATLFFGLSFIAPLNFNWLKPELLLVDSFFNIDKLSFAAILISIVLFEMLKTYSFRLKQFSLKDDLKKFLFIIPLVFAFDYSTPKEQELLSVDIDLPAFNIEQDKKWDRNYLSEIIDINLNTIDKSIENRYDVVVLPETAFPMILNRYDELLEILKEKSQNIAIITGALHSEDGLYNATYFFNKGEMQIAHKVVLVPFGEEVPFPKVIRDWINDTFYGGAEDYKTADKPTDFIVDGVKFRNAICYEATTDTLYEGNPKYMIAMSNNAWFTPSTEPTLQKLLFKYFAKKYDTTIYASNNKSENYIVTPN